MQPSAVAPDEQRSSLLNGQLDRDRNEIQMLKSTLGRA